MTYARRLAALKLGAALVPLSLLALPDVAWASCDPLAASGVNAVCSGTTSNQNDPFGFGTGNETDASVTVQSGASVTGTNTGIFLGDRATVTNLGSIAAAGPNARFGVSLGEGSTLMNAGSIAATAPSNAFAGGVSIVSGTIANAGGIAAVGGSAEGVFIGTGTLTNSGSIAAVATAADGFAIGVGFEPPGTVFNSGTITASGAGFTTAVQATALFNAGRVVAFGASGIGADMFGSSTIVNSNIISGATAAISFRDANNTLTVLPGSTIIGPISLHGAGDSVNFRGGNHNLTFGFNIATGGSGGADLATSAIRKLAVVQTFAGVTVTGTTPFAVAASGNQAAAVDPTPFAMAWRTLTDFTSAVWEAVPQVGGSAGAGKDGAPLAFAASDSSARIEGAFAAMPGLSAYAGDTIAFKAPTVAYADGSTMWARGFAGQRTQPQDGVLLHATNQFYGGMIGGDVLMQPGLRAGAFIGGGHTRTDVDFDSHDNGDLAFAGLYARYAIGATLLHAGLQGGGSQNSVSRRVNNNLAPDGIEQATAHFKGWYLSPEAMVATHVALGSFADAAYTLTPSLKLQYLYGAYGGYSETGTTAPLTVGSRIVSTFEERGELKLTRSVTFTPRDVLAVSLFGGVQGVQRAGGDTINAALLGQAIPFATPGNPGVWGGYGGAGLEWRSGAWSIFSAAEYLALSDHSHVVSGRGGLRVEF